MGLVGGSVNRGLKVNDSDELMWKDVDSEETFSSSIINIGSCTHVAIAHDGFADFKVYIDGVETDSFAYVGSETLRLVQLGKDGPTPTNWFDGTMDEVAIWKGVALDATDIDNIYNGGIPNDLTSLDPYTWWRMGDDGSPVEGSGITAVSNPVGTSAYTLLGREIDDEPTYSTDVC